MFFSLFFSCVNFGATFHYFVCFGMCFQHFFVFVHQVLVNLLSNAIKFQTDPGAIQVALSEAPCRRPCPESFFGVEADDAVKVSITDQGPGLTPEQCDRVFDAFYQVDSTSTRSHGGAGLGLSIVSKLVHAHGGDVWAESDLGTGTTFQFTVPLVERAERSPPTDPAP